MPVLPWKSMVQRGNLAGCRRLHSVETLAQHLGVSTGLRIHHFSGWSFHRVGNQQKFDCWPMAFSGGSGSAEVNRAPARGWVIRWQQASQSLSGRGKFWHLDTTDVLMILSRWGGFWQQKCGHRKKSNQRWLAGVWLSNADVGNTDPGHTLFPTAATVGFQSGCCSVFSWGPSRNGTCNPATLELRTRCWVAKLG